MGVPIPERNWEQLRCWSLGLYGGSLESSDELWGKAIGPTERTESCFGAYSLLEACHVVAPEGELPI
ncbi:uncharacterized protein BHQ10_010400 [Talaromyces amestolkiae]|uniref:Uncharacterized protein n=1 Tax=Talaromyces amestolkiae TaxID=1196081 RepID=A0A364LF20_TALAM|nr:uncharacterized protein BHQ10_010400 [Talaromyces amestolkiae]RAO74387.1 hypothetical protein BHQ10_010400 [Talaromyces amestolkiae]